MSQILLQETSEATANCQGLSLNIALNYGGRAEIVDAARRIAERAAREGRVPDFDEQTFGEYLYTRGLPDPDLLIRTSGEVRVSNFLLFQSAYTEFWTTPTLWPDFRRAAPLRGHPRLPAPQPEIRRYLTARGPSVPRRKIDGG